ncbi:hypothetical protein D5E69_05240 [Rossellomorea marisflavi]|uniref:hypothetical protein n=1 Tax=Rossellomorea marisflavi TaxID=189381 RepID=UPI0011E7BE60|nr:hypothetical protein [Rossellomorea marisflavi]QHA35281.1 hypothetical protein D5E69_05240 [Rossellomorea marisflavi]TYO68620.1 hypothetical protein DQ398_003787 [Rossellomorea marisflavi]
MKRIIIGLLGGLVFLASSVTIGLIVREYISDERSKARYIIEPLTFDEREGNTSIERLYEVVDSPPYRQIPGVTVTHVFSTGEGDEVRTATYSDYVSAMNDGGTTGYERIYAVDGNTVSLKEEFDRDQVILSVNGEFVSSFPKLINLEDSVDMRYGNVGLVRKTDRDSGTSETIMVGQRGPEAWEVFTIDLEGTVKRESIPSIKELRRDPDMVRTINHSGAHRESIGYHSQLTQGLQAFSFPVFFPLVTCVLSGGMVYRLVRKRAVWTS